MKINFLDVVAIELFAKIAISWNHGEKGKDRVFRYKRCKSIHFYSSKAKSQLY